MSPDTETEVERSHDAEDALEAQGDELEERIETLSDHIDEAKKGARARREDAEDFDEDEDGDEDPLAFDDPEADEEDDEDE